MLTRIQYHRRKKLWSLQQLSSGHWRVLGYQFSVLLDNVCVNTHYARGRCISRDVNNLADGWTKPHPTEYLQGLDKVGELWYNEDIGFYNAYRDKASVVFVMGRLVEFYFRKES
jgi:hypothetical protein